MITLHLSPPGTARDGVRTPDSAPPSRAAAPSLSSVACARADATVEAVAPSADPSVHHDTLREGALLGLLLATSTWLWVAVVDAVAGQPFHTFAILGGTALFTTVHCLLNTAYALMVVTAVHGAAGEPSLIMALGFGSLLLEFAFGMVTALLSQLGVGPVAWVGIFGGSLISLGITMTFLARRHPLAAWLRQAEEAT